MTDVIDYIRYFQKIANEHVEIKDFYIFNIQEAMNAMREGMQFPALILNTQKGSALVPHRDNTLDKVTGGFLVIDHLEQVDDFAGEMDIYQRMKDLGMQIIARMIYDKENCEPLSAKAIPGFDPNTVTYEIIDDVFNQGYGVLFSFQVITTLDLEYDISKWDSTKTLTGKTPY